MVTTSGRTSSPRVSENTATAREVLRKALEQANGAIRSNAALILLTEDPETVHDARVAVRRLRSQLKTFKRCFDDPWRRELQHDLGILGDELAALRDSEVLLDLVLCQVARMPSGDRLAAAGLLPALIERRDNARREAMLAMASHHHMQVLERITVAATHARTSSLGSQDAREVLAPMVDKEFRRTEAAARRARKVGSATSLHHLRLAAKRLRYAAEVLEPVAGKAAKRRSKRAARLQDVLGAHHDAVIAADWLRDASYQAASPTESFAAGMLAASVRRNARDAQRKWPTVWKRLAATRELTS
ncbi:MAG TPA: CHAD domain-containing protein [Acidimicrobiia bacterium]|jgi:CHAD domain-containing protein